MQNEISNKSNDINAFGDRFLTPFGTFLTSNRASLCRDLEKYRSLIHISSYFYSLYLVNEALPYRIDS